MRSKKNYSWYVIYTNPKAEKKVSQRIMEMGMETYCPVNKVLRQWSDRKKQIEEVLFKSYVFVRCSASDLKQLRFIPGFVRVLYYLGEPALVYDHEIRQIRLFLEEYADESLDFELHQHVTVTDGPLKGQAGNIVKIGKRKIKIMLYQLGISVVAEIHKNKLRA